VRITLIHNLGAGDDHPAPDEITAMLHRAGHEVRYQSADGAWEHALQWPADVVVAAGGDGTVGQVACSLLGRPPALAVLPLGTANNIAASLGLGDDLERIVAGWASARTGHMDVWRAVAGGEERLVVEAIGGGIMADLMARAGEVEAGDPPAAQETDRALRTLVSIVEAAEPAHWRVEVDGRDSSGEYLAVEALNIPFVGPNVRLSPAAVFDDGRLDVVLVRAADRERLARHLASQASGEASDAEPGASGQRDPAAPWQPAPLRAAQLRLVPPTGVRIHLDDSEWAPGQRAARGNEEALGLRVERAGRVALLLPS
jgi:diacylglycerol kinase (ATP)